MSKRCGSDSEEEIGHHSNEEVPGCSHDRGAGTSNGGGTSATSSSPPIKRPRLDHSHLLVITGTSLRGASSNGVSSNQSVRDFRVRGLCCAPVTPFKENGDLNPDIMDTYVQHLLDFGTPNVFANGTTGEGNSMSVSERKQMAEAWVKAGKGKLSAIIMHIGAGTLRESQELARHAQEVGVDAIACVSPTYHKPDTLESYVEYMRQVAAAAPQLPFFLYDIDFVTGVTFDTNEFFHMAKDKIPTLRGVKHTSPSFISMHNIIHDHGDRFQVLLGSDDTFMEALTLGMDVPIMNSFDGKILNRVKAAFESGDMATCFAEQHRAVSVGNLRRKHKFSIPGGAKAILRAVGLQVGSPRLPLSVVTDQQVEVLKKDLTDIGYFDWGTK